MGVSQKNKNVASLHNLHNFVMASASDCDDDRQEPSSSSSDEEYVETSDESECESTDSDMPKQS